MVNFSRSLKSFGSINFHRIFTSTWIHPYIAYRRTRSSCIILSFQFVYALSAGNNVAGGR